MISTRDPLRPPVLGDGEAPVKSYRVYRNGRVIGTTETTSASQDRSGQIYQQTRAGWTGIYGRLWTYTAELGILREVERIEPYTNNTYDCV